MAIDRDLGRRSPPMRSPGTIDDRARDIAPDGVPFNFYNRGPMDPPRRRFPDNMPPRFPMPAPMPMPLPSPPPGLGPRGPMMPAIPYDRNREREYFNTPREIFPGDNPFPGLEEFMRQRPVERGFITGKKPKGSAREGQRNRSDIMSDLMDMNPDMTGFQMFAMPAAATIDPSDYRTIIKMIEQGLDPEDYMNRGGIASLLR